MAKPNQKQAVATIRAAIEGNAHQDDEAVAAVEVLRNAKRLSKDAEAVLVQWKELESANDEQPTRSMAQQLAEYRKRYQDSVAPSGTRSMNNGDEVAKILGSLDHWKTCDLADRLLGLHPGTKKHPGEKKHREQYEGLNNGQIRMNAGNRIRAAVKRGDVVIEDGKLAAL